MIENIFHVVVSSMIGSYLGYSPDLGDLLLMSSMSTFDSGSIN